MIKMETAISEQISKIQLKEWPYQGMTLFFK